LGAAVGRVNHAEKSVDATTPGCGATNFAHRDRKNRTGAQVAQWLVPVGF